MYTSPTIDTTAILQRQQSTLQTNLQNITAQPTSGSTGTFWSKVNNFLDNVTPVVSKVSTITTQLQQNRVPGTNIQYNPGLQYQQPVTNRNNTIKTVAVVGGLALIGFAIYKAVK